MTTVEQTLLVILASFLAIFLVLAIIAAIFAIKLMSKVKNIVEKGEHITSNIEAATESFRSAAGPMAISRVIGTLFGAYRGAKKKGKR